MFALVLFYVWIEIPKVIETISTEFHMLFLFGVNKSQYNQSLFNTDMYFLSLKILLKIIFGSVVGWMKGKDLILRIPFTTFFCAKNSKQWYNNYGNLA